MRPLALVAISLLCATPACAREPLRVLPLGDSLTDGYADPGGYRIGFAAAAQKAHWPFTFVGSLENGPPDLPSRRHEGHRGWTIRQIDAHAGEWLGQSRPDVVLLLIGTNDVLMDDDLTHAPDRLRLLLLHLTQGRPRLRVIVSSLPPLADPRMQARVERFNAALPGVVAGMRQVRYVDLGSTVRVTDLVDGIHLSAEANRRLGALWLRALQ